MITCVLFLFLNDEFCALDNHVMDQGKSFLCAAEFLGELSDIDLDIEKGNANIR